MRPARKERCSLFELTWTFDEEGMMVTQRLGLVSLVVDDYDDGLAFVVGKLGFDLVEDTLVPEQSKRWVVVTPPGANESRPLLAQASTEEQKLRIGTQTGGRMFLFLYTNNFWRDRALQGKWHSVRARTQARTVRLGCGVYRPVWKLVGSVGAERCESERLTGRLVRVRKGEAPARGLCAIQQTAGGARLTRLSSGVIQHLCKFD